MLSIKIAKLNCIYPELLGYMFINYRSKHILRHYSSYDATADLLVIVNNAIENIPYYRRQCKTRVKALCEFESNIHFIDKEIIMGQWDDFVIPGLKKKDIVIGTTGGTSGKSLKLMLPKDRYVFELSTMYSMWKNVGWTGQIRAVIRNDHLKSDQTFRVNFLKKEIIFDGFKTTPDYYFEIYRILRKFNVGYIHAYPSSAYQFAAFLEREKLDVSFIKAFLCGSEALLPEQKELIKKRLGINLYHWYGHSEKLVLGGYCANSDLIHIEPTYGYFELIDVDGKVITEIGKRGEIVGTTLHNPYMPLIRYRTGDYAEYAGDYCEACKRHLPLIKNINGRWDINRIFLNDGTYVSITALNLHDELYSFIEGLQYVQKEKGKLEILIIRGQGYNDLIEKRFTEHFAVSFNLINS